MTRVTGLFLLSLVLGALGTGAAVASEFTLYGMSTRVVRHSDAGLKPLQRMGYQEFSKDQRYFGAMAINLVEDNFVFVRGFHSLETARAFSLDGCRRVMPDHADQCVLYASILPRRLPPRTSQASGLSQPGYVAFTGNYRANQIPGRYGAFAISGMADYGYCWNQPDEAEAIGLALAECEAAARQAIAAYSNEARASIAQRGLDKCRIVHVTRPD